MKTNASAIAKEAFTKGAVVRDPVGFTSGYWAGAPGVFFSTAEQAWYLTYRLRRPRGVAPDRGGEARIARSADLIDWQDVWSVTKDAYSSASIERSSIHLGADGQWRYFTSFVDPADGRWCVSVLKSGDVTKFDPQEAIEVFRAADLRLEGIKDPWLMERQGCYCMMLSIAVPTPKTNEQSHSTLDIFNTGECVSATGLAFSHDLDHWEWQGIVFAPEAAGWDRYCRRINSVVPVGDAFLAFYDGSESHRENYEEKTGLAVSTNLRDWKTLTPHGPAFTSPFASGSLRYVDARVVNGASFLFYELARPDGAHDLRLLKCDPAGLERLLANG